MLSKGAVSRPPNILLVEDDDVDVENVRRAFSSARITPALWIASDGEEALRMLRGRDYPRQRRLVILDLSLPKMSGIELLHAIRGDPDLCTQAIVVLTTSNEERDRHEAFRLNVAGYLLKPIAFRQFVEVMSALHRYWSFTELR